MSNGTPTGFGYRPPPGTIRADFIPMGNASQTGLVQYETLATGKARSLLELTAEYVFWTPAVLCVYGDFQDGPIADVMASLGAEFPIFVYVAPRPLFRGLELPRLDDNRWNYALWAIHQSHWLPFRDALLGVRFMDPVRELIQGIGNMELSIADPLAMSQPVLYDLPPLLPVNALGINGSKAQVSLMPSPNPRTQLPKVEVHPPNDRMVQYTKYVFQGKNPHLNEGST